MFVIMRPVRAIANICLLYKQADTAFWLCRTYTVRCVYYYDARQNTVFFRNDDGELMGLGYDIVRTVCKTMNKKCEHAVYYDYNLAYNDQKTSPGW